jgi:hypothetical protein
LLEWNGLASVTLRERLEEHSLGLFICFESLIAFREEHGDSGAFWKLRTQEFNAPIDHVTTSYSHEAILAQRTQRRPERGRLVALERVLTRISVNG